MNKDTKLKTAHFFKKKNDDKEWAKDDFDSHLLMQANTNDQEYDDMIASIDSGHGFAHGGVLDNAESWERYKTQAGYYKRHPSRKPKQTVYTKARSFAYTIYVDEGSEADKRYYLKYLTPFAQMTQTRDQGAVAFLSDVLNKRPNIEAILRKNFGNEIVDAVLVLTPKPYIDDAKYLNTIKNIKNSGNALALETMIAEIDLFQINIINKKNGFTDNTIIERVQTARKILYGDERKCLILPNKIS